MNIKKAKKVIKKADKEFRQKVCGLKSCNPNCPLKNAFIDDKGFSYCPYTMIALIGRKITEKEENPNNEQK